MAARPAARVDPIPLGQIYRYNFEAVYPKITKLRHDDVNSNFSTSSCFDVIVT